MGKLSVSLRDMYRERTIGRFIILHENKGPLVTLRMTIGEKVSCYALKHSEKKRIKLSVQNAVWTATAALTTAESEGYTFSATIGGETVEPKAWPVIMLGLYESKKEERRELYAFQRRREENAPIMAEKAPIMAAITSTHPSLSSSSKQTTAVPEVKNVGLGEDKKKVLAEILAQNKKTPAQIAQEDEATRLKYLDMLKLE